MTESVEQQALAQWLDFKRLVWTHVPNGGMRHVATGRRLKAEGVKAGVPDILIFTRPPRSQYHASGVAIELKAPKGGRVSAAQKDWLDALKSCGWHTCVAKGANEAIHFLEGLGY